MIRSAFVFGALLALAVTPSAQTFGASVSGLSTDITAVVNGNAVEFGDPLQGIGASVFVETALLAALKGGIELGYTQAGFSLDDFDQPGNPSASLRAHYLTVSPVLTATLPGGGVRPYIALGPRLDVLIAGVERIAGQRANTTQTVYDDVALSAAGGLGAVVPVASRELRAGVHAAKSWGGGYRQTTVELRLGVAI